MERKSLELTSSQIAHSLQATHAYSKRHLLFWFHPLPYSDEHESLFSVHEDLFQGALIFLDNKYLPSRGHERHTAQSIQQHPDHCAYQHCGCSCQDTDRWTIQWAVHLSWDYERLRYHVWYMSLLHRNFRIRLDQVLAFEPCRVLVKRVTIFLKFWHV